MIQSERHFDKFIRAGDRINDYRRKLQDKSTDKSERNSNKPHGYDIKDQPVARITAASEDRCDEQCVDYLTDLVNRGDKQHDNKVMLRGIADLRKRRDKRSDRKQYKALYYTCQKCELYYRSSVAAGLILLVLSDLNTEQDRGSCRYSC